MSLAQTPTSLSIAARLRLGFGCLLVLMMGIAAGGLWSLHTVNQQMRAITGPGAAKAKRVNTMLETVGALGIQSRSAAMLNEIDGQQAQAQIAAARKSLQDYQQHQAALAKLFASADTAPEQQQLLSDINALAQKARPEMETALKAIEDGDTVSATLTLMTRAAPAESAWRAKLAELIERQNQLNAASAEQAERLQGQARGLGAGLVAVAALLGWWIARRITASITLPIGRAVVVAERIARGDLTSAIEVRIHDETGRLLDAIAAMQERLRALVAEISQAADSILTASSEVASGNLDLSQRTELTSHNLQASAAALADLTGTVSQSADSAHQANHLTSSASQTATRGGQAVTQVVQTMESISASSRKIADITGVIDGIAFQTNILALNAAVEAARAGEQGRGFAVVAGEVRNLAGRAATAAREIKALIGASVQQVEQGGEQVHRAGSTMDELVGAVRKVSDIMAEITQSAQEQSQRIGQVSQSVGELEVMTQQNAALVEQGAAAADSLKEQAGRLTQVVSAFRLERSARDDRDWSGPSQGTAAAASTPPPQALDGGASARRYHALGR